MKPAGASGGRICSLGKVFKVKPASGVGWGAGAGFSAGVLVVSDLVVFLKESIGRCR